MINDDDNMCMEALVSLQGDGQHLTRMGYLTKRQRGFYQCKEGRGRLKDYYSPV